MKTKKSHCENCGERSYNGLCTNCHEECYIEEQYIELGEPVPDVILKKSQEHKRKARE